MKSVIFYYSGTGNTALACRSLASRMPIPFDLVDITRDNDVGLDSVNFVGFATSTDFWGVPKALEAFIESLPRQEAKPAFVPNTYGAVSGQTLRILSEQVAAKGFDVLAGHSLRTPESYPPMIAGKMGAVGSPGKRELRSFDRFVTELGLLAAAVRDGRHTDGYKPRIGVVNGLFPRRSRTTAREDMGEKHVDVSACTECGVCERLCPYGAIKLNPKPGSSFSNNLNKGNQTIIPDFILEIVDDEMILSLNQRNAPELTISNYYANMLKSFRDNGRGMTHDQKDALLFVKQKIDSAKWFIDAIRQRQETLMMVMNALLQFQREFFVEGEETKLKPMILKDIADLTGLDISTISRVSNSKYIQTHFGIYSLKYFFSESMQKEDGEEVSTREIKSILKECIGNENKQKPVTDDELATILKDKGYNIARRTVAKYREQLDIPVARMRKEL